MHDPGDVRTLFRHESYFEEKPDSVGHGCYIAQTWLGHKSDVVNTWVQV